MIQAKGVLLDVDNTLLDFDQCSRQAVARSFAVWGLSCGQREQDAFARVNHRMWSEVEQGRRTRQELERDRWQLIFQELGIEGDGPVFEKLFRRQLSQTGCLEPGALELVRYLAARYPVYYATNGLVESQIGRLTASGLLSLARGAFIYEEIGYPKPDPRFFDACMRSFPGVRRSEICLIGDSADADIAGAQRYGFRTIWYDRERSGAPSAADAVVQRLSDVRRYL